MFKASPDKIFSFLEQLSSKNDDKVGGVAHLVLLHLGAKDHHLGRRMLNLQFSEKYQNCLISLDLIHNNSVTHISFDHEQAMVKIVELVGIISSLWFIED